MRKIAVKSSKKKKKKGVSPWYGVMLFCCLIVSVVGITLAFFFSSDYASNMVTLSGPVNIEAVGKNGVSIEDIEATGSDPKISKLTIELSDGYTVLIPGMPIEITANCKVYRSTTKPLLRAKFDLTFYKESSTPGVYEEVEDLPVQTIATDITSDIESAITSDNSWVKFTDGYFYFIGSNTINSTLGNTILFPIDATETNPTVPFLNGTGLTVPENIDSTMSGYSIYLSITFEGIQDFVPDSSGHAVENTITNAKKIFDSSEG